jgi:hypothetical protein
MGKIWPEQAVGILLEVEGPWLDFFVLLEEEESYLCDRRRAVPLLRQHRQPPHFFCLVGLAPRATVEREGRSCEAAGEAAFSQLRPGRTALESAICDRFSVESISGVPLARLCEKQLPQLLTQPC